MRGDGKWREIITLAAPVVISKLSFTAMSLVDTAMVGRLGASELAAVGIATTYMFTLYVFGLGMIGVVNTFVSQHLGAGNPRACGIVLGNGLRLATVVGAVTLVVALLSRPLFHWAGLSQDVAELGYAYLFFRVMGLPGVYWYWAYNSFFEGIGETRTPMWISLAANVVNAALDYALIFGAGPIPALGVEGAGMATAFSNLFMLACFAVVVHRRGSPYSRFGVGQVFGPTRWSMMRQMVRMGLPMGVQFFLEVGSFLIFSVMIGWVSDAALAANQVAVRLMSISFMTAWGISVAATTLVGRHQGEGRFDLAFSAGMRTIALVLGYTLVCGALFASIPGRLAGLFTPFSEVARMATTLLYVAAAVQVFDGVSMVCYGTLRGAGDTRGPLLIIVVLNWGLGVPLVYVLTITARLGALGAWIGLLVMLACQGLVMFRRFRAGKWRALKVVDQALLR